MQKILGALVILAAALGYASFCIRNQREHLRQLLLWKEYIWAIQNRMESWNMPVIPLLEEMGENSQKPFSSFFSELASSLQTYDEADVLKQWRSIAEKKQKEFEWNREEWDTFLDGGKMLVRLDKELIRKEGTQLSGRVDFFYKQAQAESAKREKLYLYLSTSAGIMLILLLV